MFILHNATIYAPGQNSPTAIAIDQGSIRALGSDTEILDVFPQAAHIFNLEGRTLWPGLIDAHVHLQQLAASQSMVDCETETLEECLQRVKHNAKQLPADAWVRGHGWNQNRWQGGYGTANVLDAICGGRPAYLTAKSLHAAWANHKALELAGITKYSPDPPGGTIQRDQNGDPTGILFEAEAMNMVEKSIPEQTSTEITTQIESLIPELWKKGLVGVHDFDRFGCWEVLHKLSVEKKLKFRVRKNIPFDRVDDFIDAGLTTDVGNDWLQIGNVKLFSDGALGPQTAAMFEPYLGTDQSGILLLSEEEIFEIGQTMADHHLALSVHAIGDRANHIVLNAFERLRSYEKQTSLPQCRHRIEHVQIIDPTDLPRLAALDVIASVQPIHATSDMLMADKYLGEKSINAYPFNTLLKSGAVLMLGSDAPVESINPFEGIHAAVTRRRRDGSPGEDGWHPSERITLDAAIAGFSQNPAGISKRHLHFGKISPGYKADFLILERNPFSIDKQQLAAMSPAATFIDGECVFQTSTLPYDFEVLNN